MLRPGERAPPKAARILQFKFSLPFFVVLIYRYVILYAFGAGVNQVNNKIYTFFHNLWTIFMPLFTSYHYFLHGHIVFYLFVFRCSPISVSTRSVAFAPTSWMCVSRTRRSVAPVSARFSSGTGACRTWKTFTVRRRATQATRTNWRTLASRSRLATRASPSSLPFTSLYDSLPLIARYVWRRQPSIPLE